MIKPKMSVILSTYSRNRPEGNCPNLLKRALDSVLEQTITDFELILIDDGSTDGSDKICQEYAQRDNRIKYYRFDSNSGIPAKRYNDGMLLSSAPYVTFMFDDDKWYPNALKYLIEAMEEDPSCGMIYGLTNYMNVNTGTPLQLNFGAEWSWELIDRQNFLCNNSVIVKREVIDQVGGYDEDPIMRRLCDWDLWWRIGREFEVKRISKLIGEVHAFHKDSIGVMIPYDFDTIKALQIKPDRKVRLQGELKKKLVFSFIHHGHDSALQRWRIWYLSEQLNKMGHSSKCLSMGDPIYSQRCFESDIIIFYRCYQPQIDFIRKLVANNKLVIYDIDDYVFQMGAKALFNSPAEAKLINEYLSEVNCYSASTVTLLNQMPKNNRPRMVRSNAIDRETFELLATNDSVVNKKRFRIGWTVGINRVEMQYFVQTMLSILASKLPGCEFWYFGKANTFYREIIKIPNLKVTRLAYTPTANWKAFYKTLRMSFFDAVINPLEENNIFFHSKSQIKFLEHGSLGYPLITSRVKPFTEFMKEGETGYFASTPQEFVAKIIHIKEHPEEVARVTKNAQQYVLDHYMIEGVAEQFIKDCVYSKLIVEVDNKKKIIGANYIPDIVQDLFGYVTEELIHPLIHEFNCRKNRLCRIELLGSVINRGTNAAFKLIIKNKNTNEIVLSKTYNVREMDNNSWWGIEFPPVEQSKDCTFEVSIIPKDISIGESFKLYLNLLPYALGKYFIDGKLREGCLAFKTYCASNGELPVKDVIPKVEEAVVVTKTSASRNVEPEGLRYLLRKKGTWADVMMLLPIAKHLKQKNKNSKIFISTNHSFLFKDNPYVESVLPWESNVSNINKRVDFELVHENDPQAHVLDTYLKLAIGHTDIPKEMEIYISEFDEDFVNRLIIQLSLVEKEFVIFHCGLLSRNKTLPNEKWTRTISHCLAQGIKVVVIGHGSDYVSPLPGVINLVNKLNFFQSKHLISKSKLIVCLDDDYLQLAGTTETRIVGIFTATLAKYKLPYRRGILGHDCVIVEAPVGCVGCWHKHIRPINYHGCCMGTFACLNSITSNMIWEKVQ